MKKAGIMGWPVAHSLSPRIHGYWLEKYGIAGSYERLPMAPEGLGEALAGLKAGGFCGVNLTIPHKEAAVRFLEDMDDVVRNVRAVNTIVVKENGDLKGLNTDVFGFAENLRHAGCKMNGKRAVVLGAGGAARAVVVALLEGGSSIHLVNRTQERAKKIAEKFGRGITTGDWSNCAGFLEKADLLINTTSLGMAGQPSLEIDLAALPVGAWVTDIVYAPLETDLLKQARARGLRAVDGLGMLLHQARPAFQAWFGVDPEVTGDLRKFVLEGL